MSRAGSVVRAHFAIATLRAISCLLCRSKAISDGFSIRGADKVPSFRFSERVEGVTESVLPPVFKCCAMLFPQFIQPRRRQLQFCRMGFARQNHRPQHLPTLRFNMAAQVGQRATHADEVIHHHVACTRSDRAVESGLSREAGETIGPGMGHDVRLHDAAVHRPSEHLPQPVGQYFWNGVDAFSLIRMRTDERWLPVASHVPQVAGQARIKNTVHQFQRSPGITAFCSHIGDMLLHGGFARVNQHIGKIIPRTAGWVHGRDASSRSLFGAHA